MTSNKELKVFYVWTGEFPRENYYIKIKKYKMQLLETLHARTTKNSYKPNVGVVEDMVEFMKT